ncbi:MAG: lysine--tRNA ligase [Candidatus Pacearchaeota archaeon]|jgi:lysyl-tRNA synthetase class 2
MGREEQIIESRIKKIEELKQEGIDPYPAKYDARDNSKEIQEKHAKLKANSSSKDEVKIAGRVLIKRDMGKICFGTVLDSTGKIQVVSQEGETPEKVRELFRKYADSGDFIGVEGNVIKTKTGEISILIKKLDILSKAILPLPEKWHGLKDDEEKLRKRYLDIIMDEKVRELFIKKSKFWQTIRNFLLEREFLEVETPVLENSAGGASATPFKTHHNALDLNVYLRISMGELWQKKLMVAGYGKTFEIGRQFRNEGMDMEHLQDYTQMEFYWAYADYKDGMKLVEEMYERVAREVLGTLKFKTRGYEVDFGKKWELYDYEEVIKKHTGIKIYSTSEKEIKEKLDELRVEYEDSVDKWRLVDVLWKHCRKKLSGPGFLVNQPVEISPLAKRSIQDSRKVQQFQVIIAGTELGNGYSELNDPIDQEERFRRQAELKAAGDSEAQDHDKDFVEALRYGMPPTCGFGVSERLFSYLVDRPIRECVIFPLMRPKEISEGEEKLTHVKNDVDKKIEEVPISREEAMELIKKYNKDKSDINHYLESEAVMKALAKHLGENEKVWGMLGLLHDVDWGITKENTVEHLTKAPEILKKAGFSENFISVILSHGYGFMCGGGNFQNKERTEKIEHALACSETVTGLIHAYALMRGSISGMKVKGLKDKFKDKRFAAAISRDIIKECEKLGVSLDNFLEIAINAITSIAKEVDLS